MYNRGTSGVLTVIQNLSFQITSKIQPTLLFSNFRDNSVIIF